MTCVEMIFRSRERKFLEHGPAAAHEKIERGMDHFKLDRPVVWRTKRSSKWEWNPKRAGRFRHFREGTIKAETDRAHSLCLNLTLDHTHGVRTEGSRRDQKHNIDTGLMKAAPDFRSRIGNQRFGVENGSHERIMLVCHRPDLAVGGHIP